MVFSHAVTGKVLVFIGFPNDRHFQCVPTEFEAMPRAFGNIESTLSDQNLV